MPKSGHGAGDATGVRSDPLAKWVPYYGTHLAKSAKRGGHLYEHQLEWASGEVFGS